MRLDKYVAGAAQQSRSDVRRAIQKGLVCVNGAVCRSADAQVPAGAAVTLNGQPLVLQQYVYIMLDKPKGVVSAAADKNDVTVVDLVGRAYPRRSLFPAGRLPRAFARRGGAYPRRLENRKKFRAKCWKLHFRRAVHRFLKHFSHEKCTINAVFAPCFPNYTIK